MLEVGETFLLRECKVQVYNLLAVLKTSQVPLSHKNVIFEAFPKKSDPQALGIHYIMLELGTFLRVQVENCNRVMAF